MTLTQEEKIKTGKRLADVLKLKSHYAYAKDEENLRYDTAWGTKTALGVYETINRIIEEKGKV